MPGSEINRRREDHVDLNFLPGHWAFTPGKLVGLRIDPVHNRVRRGEGRTDNTGRETQRARKTVAGSCAGLTKMAKGKALVRDGGCFGSSWVCGPTCHDCGEISLSRNGRDET